MALLIAGLPEAHPGGAPGPVLLRCRTRDHIMIATTKTRGRPTTTDAARSTSSPPRNIRLSAVPPRTKAQTRRCQRGGCPSGGRSFEAVAAIAAPRVETFTPRQLARTAWAFAHAGRGEAAVAAAAHGRIERRGIARRIGLGDGIEIELGHRCALLLADTA